MELFKKYQLEPKEMNGSIYIATDNSSLLILAQFLDHWNRSKDIKEDLLPELDPVILGEMESNDIGADVIGLAYIKPDITLLEMSDVGYSDMELPTTDFKGLIMEWLSILESQGR